MVNKNEIITVPEQEEIPENFWGWSEGECISIIDQKAVCIGILIGRTEDIGAGNSSG